MRIDGTFLQHDGGCRPQQTAFATDCAGGVHSFVTGEAGMGEDGP